MLRKLKRLICLALYYGVFRNCPEHSLPRGKLWMLLRRWTVTPVLRHGGKDLAINKGAHFGSGSTFSMGDSSSLGINARIIGDVTFGDYVGMAHDVFITAYGREFGGHDVPMMFQGKVPDKPVVIEDNVLLFASVIILPGVRVCTGSIIGAGAVVSRNVPPYAIVGGNPARIVKWRKEPKAEWLEGPNMTPLAGDHLKPKS
jgi:maltose O-acetyltransferase